MTVSKALKSSGLQRGAWYGRTSGRAGGRAYSSPGAQATLPEAPRDSPAVVEREAIPWAFLHHAALVDNNEILALTAWRGESLLCPADGHFGWQWTTGGGRREGVTLRWKDDDALVHRVAAAAVAVVVVVVVVEEKGCGRWPGSAYQQVGSDGAARGQYRVIYSGEHHGPSRQEWTEVEGEASPSSFTQPDPHKAFTPALT
ncbi:hypothetical protein E2C01_015592 [Portunus trituberculatus]|uniref:Uncharacterized protein n=1 Tax=Portunus trituberculatus TaxID=210409 RepID=A0A5B7DN05_PORTR|nr:hypothetical protein [Portunus trituberculatus]